MSRQSDGPVDIADVAIDIGPDVPRLAAMPSADIAEGGPATAAWDDESIVTVAPTAEGDGGGEEEDPRAAMSPRTLARTLRRDKLRSEWMPTTLMVALRVADVFVLINYWDAACDGEIRNFIVVNGIVGLLRTIVTTIITFVYDVREEVHHTPLPGWTTSATAIFYEITLFLLVISHFAVFRTDECSAVLKNYSILLIGSLYAVVGRQAFLRHQERREVLAADDFATTATASLDCKPTEEQIALVLSSARVVERQPPREQLAASINGDGGSDGEGDVCMICLGDLDDDGTDREDDDDDDDKSNSAVLALYGCGHRFHEHCLAEWLAVKLQCPTCRSSRLVAGEDGEDTDSFVTA